MADENQDVGGLVGLLRKIRNAPGPSSEPNAVSPELQAQGITGDMAPQAVTRTGENPYYPGQDVKPEAMPPQTMAGPQAPLPKTYSTIQEAEKDVGGKAVGNPDPQPPILTENAVAAARPAMARGSFARGGTPGQQPGGPTGDGDSLDAPVEIEDDTHKALVASGVNPALAAMLADQKKRQDQLADANKQQRGERFAADELYAMRSGFGIRGADQIHQSELATADQHLQNIKDQQAAGDQALQSAEQMRSFTHALDMEDPNSQISQQVAQITGHKGVPASLYPQIADKIRNRLEQQKIQHEDKRAAGVQEGENLRNRETNKTKIDVANIEAASRANSAKDQVSDRVSVQTQGGQEMVEVARDLRSLAKKVGLGATLTRGDTSNAAYQQAILKAARAEEKSISGTSTESGASQFLKTYPDPRVASPDAIMALADDLERRGRERVANLNRTLESQRKLPVPTPTVDAGNVPVTEHRTPRAAAAPVGATKNIGGTTYVKTGPNKWEPQR